MRDRWPSPKASSKRKSHLCRKNLGESTLCCPHIREKIFTRYLFRVDHRSRDPAGPADHHLPRHRLLGRHALCRDLWLLPSRGFQSAHYGSSCPLTSRRRILLLSARWVERRDRPVLTHPSLFCAGCRQLPSQHQHCRLHNAGNFSAILGSRSSGIPDEHPELARSFVRVVHDPSRKTGGQMDRSR